MNTRMPTDARGLARGPAVAVKSLTKQFGDLLAVDNVSFDVADHEIFGIIGPNGAGKTTLMECLEGIQRRTSGAVRVLGADPDVADR
jgi:ABC-type multidrug transport system, ATPase component